jgi:hypothetical protein
MSQVQVPPGNRLLAAAFDTALGQEIDAEGHCARRHLNLNVDNSIIRKPVLLPGQFQQPEIAPELSPIENWSCQAL